MPLADDIDRFIDADFPRETAFLAELVKVPSDNPPGDCAAHAARAQELLEGLGFQVEAHKVPDADVRAAGMISVTNLIVRHRFGAGPTIAHLTAAGARVDYVVTTDGSKGTEDPNVTPEELASTRMAEQRAAADLLGVTDIAHLGYPDGYLQPTLELRRDITRQIRRFRPDLVITQNPQRRLDHNPFIGHPDHLATGEATLASVYPAARDHLNFPELWTEEKLAPWKVRQVLLTGVEEPNLWIDVADTFELGLRSILAHVSQVDPATVEERMRERARIVGEPQGIGLAQAFLSIILE